MTLSPLPIKGTQGHDITISPPNNEPQGHDIITSPLLKVHKDMILAQTKSAVEQKSQVSSELHERISTVDKLKKRLASYCLLNYSFQHRYSIYYVCILYTL